MVGSVFLAKIYFTDRVEYKLRPILIIQKNSFGDLVYIPFSTNPYNRYAFEFKNTLLKEGGFNKQSYLIIDKTCTISSNLLTKKIATLKEKTLQEVLSRYCDFLHRDDA